MPKQELLNFIKENYLDFIIDDIYDDFDNLMDVNNFEIDNENEFLQFIKENIESIVSDFMTNNLQLDHNDNVELNVDNHAENMVKININEIRI